MSKQADETPALPQGWVYAKLEDLVINPKRDIVDGPFGSNLKASEYVDHGVPIIRLQNVKRNQFVAKNIRYVSAAKAEALGRHNFKAGDVVVSKLGNPLGEACVVPPSLQSGIIVADVVRVRIAESYCDRAAIVQSINSEFVVRQLQRLTKGTTRPRVNLGHVRCVRIPLPPLAEQQRIVAESEKQFTRLDAAVVALIGVRSNLSRYRASVLRAACEGRLVRTEAELARAEGREYEPADMLVERILSERRAKFQTEAKGTRVSAKRRKGKYTDGRTPDGTSSLKLPEGWVWATMPQLGELDRGKSKHRPRDDQKLFGGSYPFIQTGDVRRSGGLIREHSQTYNEFGLKQSRLWPANTLCITIAANIAETGFLTYPACFPDSVVGFSSDGDPLTVRYIEKFLRTARQNLERFAPATAQKNINLETLSRVNVPLPPLAEQHRIVAEVERRLSVVDELEALVRASLKRAERLRQSILKRAFEGKLVPQDPSDEPAAVLLERIRAERKATSERDASRERGKRTKKKEP